MAPDAEATMAPEVHQEVTQKVGELEQTCDILRDLPNSEYFSVEAKAKLETSVNQMSTIAKKIEEIINNSGKNKFSSWINEYYDFLNSLTLQQECAFINILLFLLIILVIFNFLAIFLGNEFISYFKLESKFPSLAYFFKLRTKYQKYYLIWNTVILFFICFIGVFINILSLI